MFTAYKLPRFLDYLFDHYQRFYKLYSGRLTELFPSGEETEASLSISEDDEEINESDKEKLFELWREFK